MDLGGQLSQAQRFLTIFPQPMPFSFVLCGQYVNSGGCLTGAIGNDRLIVTTTV